jgi:hypothetical protein
VPIQEEVENIEYSGELITGLETTSSRLVEKTVNVQTVAKKMATDFISTTISLCTKQLDTTIKNSELIKKTSRGFVCKLLSPFTRKNKVHPMGGSRKKRGRSVKKMKTVKGRFRR